MDEIESVAYMAHERKKVEPAQRLASQAQGSIANLEALTEEEQRIRNVPGVAEKVIAERGSNSGIILPPETVPAKDTIEVSKHETQEAK